MTDLLLAAPLDDAGFDRAVLDAVFAQVALRGWATLSLVEAGQEAALDLGRLRARFPDRAAVLLAFGRELDQAALAGVVTQGSPRERLFDILMYRFEALNRRRQGVIALMTALPTDPPAALLLYGATLRSMRWMLEGAGITASGLLGLLRIHGLLALWLYALRRWEQDDSPDLSATMRTLDEGLDRALQVERSLPFRRPDGDEAEAAPSGV